MIIKTLAENENFVNAVTVLFQAVVTSCIPNPWKRAIVTALHRKVPLKDACNYRPISLTCILCKVFEKLLYRHLYSTHVRENLSPHQHGFVQGKSCLSNLLETVHEINTILEDGEEVDLVYLDLDYKVSHERLLLKLKAHGMTGQCNNIIRNFVTGRTIAVRVGGELGNLIKHQTFLVPRTPTGSIFAA